MKKLIIYLLITLLTFTLLAACGDGSKNFDNRSKQTSSEPNKNGNSTEEISEPLEESGEDNSFPEEESSQAEEQSGIDSIKRPEYFGLTAEYDVVGRYPTTPRADSNPMFWFYIKNDGGLYAKHETYKTVNGGTVYYANGTEYLIAPNVKALYYIEQTAQGTYIVFLDSDNNLLHLLCKSNRISDSAYGATVYDITAGTPELILANVIDYGKNTGEESIILCKDGSVYFWLRKREFNPVNHETEFTTDVLTKIADDGARLLSFQKGLKICYFALSQTGELFGYERDSFDNKYVKKSYFSGAKVLSWDSNPAFWGQSMSGSLNTFIGSSGTGGMYPIQTDVIETLLFWDSDSEKYYLMKYFDENKSLSQAYNYSVTAIPDNKLENAIKDYISANDFIIEYHGTGGFNQLIIQRDENNTLFYKSEKIAENVKSFGAYGDNGENLCYLTYNGDFYIQNGTGMTFEKKRENVNTAVVSGWRNTLVFLFNDGTLVNSNGDVYATDLMLIAD